MTSIDPARPSPLEHGELAPALAAVARGATFKEALELLLLALPDERADKLMQDLRESRGAWFPLLRASGGELLFLGSSLSGTVTPLAASGFRVTALDPSAERAEFARVRNEAHSPGAITVVVGGTLARLPFDDASFDVVVQEDGAPDAGGMFAHGFDECLRVSRGEVVLTADNRLAYKRSSGRRSDFTIPSPIDFVRHALRPPRGERTLHGYRRLFTRIRGDEQPGIDRLGAGRIRFESPRAYALYPHARDFAFVVALDERRPGLAVGPMERKNRIKVAARSLGLVPVFTPSFALIGARALAARQRPRIERILMEIAQRTGEPLPEIEQLIATRGNTAVIHTSIPGSGEAEPRGRWTLHVPLCPKNIPQLSLHYRTLELLRVRFPDVPVPEPLVHGRIDGAWMTCERRLPGLTAPQVTSDRVQLARMLADASRHFARLVVRAPAAFTDADYEELIGKRIDLVAAHAAVPTTIDALRRMRDTCRARFVGRRIARVLYHADLRGKHVQLARGGGVIGYLDWGTTEPEGLPYFDLLHLVVHERKQAHNCSAGEAWNIVKRRVGLHEYEASALANYRNAVEVDDETARALEDLYPVLVAAMAEKNWDYSRPRWLHRQFGI